MSQIEEQELVRRTLGGDQNAFERLYRTHFPRTCTIVETRVWNREDVEDLVQTAFMQAYLGLEGFRGEAAFSTWLTQIALNVCATHLRVRLSRRAWMNAVTGPASELRKVWEPARSEDPEEALYWKECQERVKQAVEGLPTPCQEAVWMRYIEDRSYNEITQELQVSMGTVKTWLYRARQQLKADFQQIHGMAM
jgi:RNA polymerase sigma-70 factor (ECF subfamily)